MHFLYGWGWGVPVLGAARTKVTACTVKTLKNWCNAANNAGGAQHVRRTPAVTGDMARIQFNDFDDAQFHTDLVCPPPLHPGAHTDNVQLLQLVSQARVRFFAALGYRENNVAGVQIFVGDQAAQYKAEAFPGQTVQVQMAVRDRVNKGFDLVYRMVDVDSGQLILLGKIGIVCVDRQSKRPCAVPAALVAQLQALQVLETASAA